MIVGELRDGQLVIIDRVRETVRLAAGLSEHGELADDARTRAIGCLTTFGKRLQVLHVERVRVAGTSTIRRVRADSIFLADAEQALGHEIEIISGTEEARLIFSGVNHTLSPNDGLRLVIDIGGGSTEVILGEGSSPRALESLRLGCVSMTEMYFPDGRITRDAFDAARKAARVRIRPVKDFFRAKEDIEVIGTSGTIIATEHVARSSGLQKTGTLALRTIEALIEQIIDCGSIEAVNMQDLSERRAQVWPGGLAILAELVSELQIREMRVSNGALREGLLYDLLSRVQTRTEQDSLG